MLKKYFIFILFLFSLTACSNKQELQVETIIEEKNHYKIGINYPITGYSSLDEKIKEYVYSNYNNFLKDKNKSNSLDTLEELNIDYTLFKNNYLISITIFKSENLDSEIQTFNYDYKNNNFISLNYFSDIKNIYSKTNTIIFKRYGNVIDIENLKNNLNTTLFSIDQDNLYLYYEIGSLSKVYKDHIIIDIPLKELNIEFDVIKKTSVEVDYNNIDLNKVNKIIDTNSKVIALTFDDGPSSYTKDIITILKENDAVATFFVLGNKVELYQDVLRDSLKCGNEIGNHTYNHKWLTKLSDDEIKKQIEDTQNIIKENLGITPTLFRPSYGSINKRVRKDINLDIVLWNIDTMDWKYKNVDKIVDRAVRNASDGSIILMHETYSRTKEALPKIISILKDKGFSFVTISELKEIEYLRKQDEYKS